MSTKWMIIDVKIHVYVEAGYFSEEGGARGWERS